MWDDKSGYWRYTPRSGVDPTYPKRPQGCCDEWYWHAGFGMAVQFKDAVS